MNRLSCNEAREVMLVADVDELQQHADSPLGAHLAVCADCRAIAQRLLAGTVALAEALDAVTTEAAAARIHTGAPRKRRLLGAMAPLAAAAVLLVMLLQRDALMPRDALQPILLPPERVPASPVVNAAASGTVAVMSTSNPNITVVWHMENAR